MTPFVYDAALRDRIAANLAGHDRRVIDAGERRRAAVAVLLLDSVAGEDGIDPHAPDLRDLDVDGRDVYGLGETGLDDRMVGVAGGAALVLCRRAPRLTSHGGQWALPGGRLDEGENAVEAAIREVAEEVGVHIPAANVLGLLDDYATRSGYVITPVVLWGGGLLELHPSPDEVAAVYRLGIHELFRADSPRFVMIPESDRPVVQVPLGGVLVHAPTAAVLVQFRWLGLEGKADPVVDFEQPVFAWR